MKTDRNEPKETESSSLGQVKEVLGSVLSAIGTIEAALGSTPLPFINNQLGIDLRKIGNVLQATGNALSADGQGTPLSFEQLGDEIQAIGNSTVLVGLYINYGSDNSQKLIITGNWLQSIGSFVGLTDEYYDSTPSGRWENIVGGYLQGIGNALQAVDGTEQLKKPTKQTIYSLGVIGSWIQALGSVISLIGQIKEETQELELGINE